MANPHYVWPAHVLTLTGAPEPLLSLAFVKSHLRVDHADDDAYILALIKTAEAAIDGPNGMVGKAIATQRWTLKRERMIGTEPLALPVVPFRSVVSIAYYDADNVLQTLGTAEAIGAAFSAAGNEDWGQIAPVTSWPAMSQRPDALTVVFEAGYGDPDDCPANLRHAALMMIAHWYENREAASDGSGPVEVPLGARELIGISCIGWAGA